MKDETIIRFLNLLGKADVWDFRLRMILKEFLTLLEEEHTQ